MISHRYSYSTVRSDVRRHGPLQASAQVELASV
jgi:hypothetical protein